MTSAKSRSHSDFIQRSGGAIATPCVSAKRRLTGDARCDCAILVFLDRRLRLLLFLIVAFLATRAFEASGASKSAPKLVLTMAAAPLQSVTAGITFTATLRVDPTSPAGTSVTAFPLGSLCIQRVKKIKADGRGTPVKPQKVTALFPSPPQGTQTARLTHLAPGESVDVRVESLRHPDGSALFLDIRPNKNPQKAQRGRIFVLSEPGIYAFEFCYRYAGALTGLDAPFRKLVRAAPITIEVAS